jgi:hypothetical protein
MSAKLKEDEFRDRFDAGESLESLGFDLNKGVIEEPHIKRVNVDFPDSVVTELDRYAALMGVTRQALIKVWIFERLREEAVKPVSTVFGHYRPQGEFQSKEEMPNLATGLERTISNIHRTEENILDLQEILRRSLDEWASQSRALHQLQSESKKKG